MTRISAPIALWMCMLVPLAGCAGGETPGQGSITAQITCNARDSLLATIYMAGGDRAAASEWCSCAEECSVEFGSLGYGDYLLGIGSPDSTYLASEGAEGFVRPLGYFHADGLANDPAAATTITLSDDSPNASVEIVMDGEGSPSRP